jgi:hypothetical protein
MAQELHPAQLPMLGPAMAASSRLMSLLLRMAWMEL